MELYIGVGSTRFPLELAKFDGLEALDAALRLELFQALQTVKLHVSSYKGRSDLEKGSALTKSMLAVIKNKLPELFARNIVEVSAYRY